MLARRELSEAQIRQRLAKRGESRDSIDEAVDRLKAERSIDDERVAGAIARTQAAGRNRGRRRVMQQIEAAGIDKSIAATYSPNAVVALAVIGRRTGVRARAFADDARASERRAARILHRAMIAAGICRTTDLVHARRAGAALAAGRR